jgi:hypothetical protein
MTSPLRELSGQTFEVTLRSPDGSTELVGKTVLHASGAGTRFPRVHPLARVKRFFHGHHHTSPSPILGLPALPPGTTRALASHAFSRAPSSTAATTKPIMSLPPGTRAA